MGSNDILREKIEILKQLDWDEPLFDKDWLLKNMMGFSENDKRMIDEQIRHERTMKSRILKLKKIVNEINRK